MSVDVSGVPDAVLQPIADLGKVLAKQAQDVANEAQTASDLAKAKAADSDAQMAVAQDQAALVSGVQAADLAIASWASPPSPPTNG